MIVVGSMIGSGIFITSAESARLTGAPGWLLLAWAIAGLMTITGALCCSELAAMMPRAGGVYVFLREAYGPSIGFLFGWTLFLVIQTGTIAAVAIAFAKFVGVFAPAIATDHYLVPPDPSLRRLRHQSFDRATRGRRPDSVAHLDKHARSRDRKVCPEHIYLREDGGPSRPDRHRPFVRLESRAARRSRRIGGIRGGTGGVRRRRSRVSPSSAGLRSRCFLARRWSVRSSRKPPGRT